MKFLLGLILVMGSLAGGAVSFLSSVTVSSSLTFINGMNVSLALGVFFIVAFFGGLYAMFSSDAL